jgi:hypothetical protein
MTKKYLPPIYAEDIVKPLLEKIKEKTGYSFGLILKEALEDYAKKKGV